jgi:hypothetical protein
VKNINPVKINRQLGYVYEEGAKNGRNVRKCCLLFSVATTDVHNETRSALLSVIAKDFKDRFDAKLSDNGRLTIDELHETIVIRFFETSAHVQTTLRYIPEDGDIH